MNVAEQRFVPRSEWLGLFNSRKVSGKWLLTNRVGDWELVTEAEYEQIHDAFTPVEIIQRLATARLVLFGSDVNSSDLLKAWGRYNRGFYGGPYLHIIHLTQRCNLGCAYCHSAAIPLEAKGRDLLPDTADRIAGFVSRTPSDRIHINFQGGEPTLMVDLIDRIMGNVKGKCERQGKRVSGSLTTNATMIDRRILDVLRKYKIDATVSIDGPEDLHDSVRKNRDGTGSYDAAMKGREMLLADGDISAKGTILVLTKKTVSQVERLVDEYVSLGQHRICLKPMTKLGRGVSAWDGLSISFEEYWEAYMRALKHMLQLQQRGFMITELSLLLTLTKILEGRDTTYVDLRNPCGIVYGVLNYDIDGTIYACHEGKRKEHFLLGNVDQEPEEILFSDKARKLSRASVLDANPVCRACTYLPYCGPCPAHNYQQNGDTSVRPYEDWACRFTLALNDFIFEQLAENPEPLMVWWRYAKFREIAVDAQCAT